MAGSGMCTGGRIKHHLAHNISRPESTILFVGYQARETLGRQILEGAPEVRIHGQTFPVRARVTKINGFSAHADRKGLVRWLDGFKTPPRRLFVTHGDADVAAKYGRTGPPGAALDGGGPGLPRDLGPRLSPAIHKRRAVALRHSGRPVEASRPGRRRP